MSELHKSPAGDWPSDAEIASRARAIFRDACQATDSAHAVRLGMARRKAANARGARSAARTWMPLAGGMAACCALAIGLAWLRPLMHGQPARTAASPAPIMAADASGAALDIGSSEVEVVQNLDFYRWLATQPSIAQSSSGSAR